MTDRQQKVFNLLIRLALIQLGENWLAKPTEEELADLWAELE